MAEKKQSKFINVPFSCTPELKDEIDARAHELGLSRSAYIQTLIRQDLGESDLIILSKKPIVQTAPTAAEERNHYQAVRKPGRGKIIASTTKPKPPKE